MTNDQIAIIFAVSFAYVMFRVEIMALLCTLVTALFVPVILATRNYKYLAKVLVAVGLVLVGAVALITFTGSHPLTNYLRIVTGKLLEHRTKEAQ